MRRHPSLLPIAATVLAIAAFSAMDALMKRASSASGVYGALLLRSLLAGSVMGLVWRGRGGRRAGRGALPPAPLPIATKTQGSLPSLIR